LTCRAPSVCERQAERYRSHSHDVFPEGCHFTYSDSAAGLISASTRSRNLRLTAKRMFRCESFQRKGVFLFVRQLSV
jgi:putative component of membrane protein insertase Oxa1/YidC/SpoIIIJ protein YidD